MKDLIKNKAVQFYVFIAVIVLIILLIRDFIVGLENLDWDGIWVEAHGMWFDIVILGVLLAIYDHFRDKKAENERMRLEQENKIRLYNEQIWDYRGWKETEATYRIVGIIRRLNELGVENIFLVNCHLKDANLTGTRLNSANLRFSDLKEAAMWNCELFNANLEECDLRGMCPIVMGADRINFYRANFKGAKLDKAKAYEYQKEQLIECGADELEIGKMKFYPNPPNLIKNKFGIFILDTLKDE
jgi:Pentapeptide repeats (8 copies)